MTAAPDIIKLRTADEAPALPLDPRVFERNLAAVRTHDSALAEALAAVPAPAHWRAVFALDGSPTYRVEPPGAPAAWLDGAAAPLTRAEGLLGEFRCGDTNAALPGIATGAELAYLLQHLPAIRAVFVFEPELARLAAVLRFRDFSADLARLRVVLVPPRRERPALRSMLESHAGLLPPGSILRLLGASAAQVDQVRAICEEIMTEVAPARLARLRELAAKPPMRASTDKPRLAVVAFDPDIDPNAVDGWLHAAAALGWEAVGGTLRGPTDVHLLPHAERLAALEPTLTLCVGHPVSRLPFPPCGAACEWHIAYPPQTPSDLRSTLHLAATPRIAHALRSAGAPVETVIEVFWAVDPHARPATDITGTSAEEGGRARPSAFSPSSPLATATSVARDADALARFDALPTPVEAADTPPVVFVADLPDDTPGALGIEQPTHRLLWQHACEAARAHWQSADITHAEALLRHAERTARLPLDDAAARARLLQLIETHAAPAAVAAAIVGVLREACGSVGVVGQGWNRIPSGATVVAESATGRLQSTADQRTVAAAVFPALPDPLSSRLLHVAAAGVPVLIHAPAQFSLAKWLGGVLFPGEHATPFTDARDLRNRITQLLRQPDAACAQARRTTAHLLGAHTFAARLEALRGRLSPST